MPATGQSLTARHVVSFSRDASCSPRLFTVISLLIFGCAAYLSLVRLDNTYFWDDEAEVGIIARNLANTGGLTAWDGRNLFAYYYGTTIDVNLRPINPPLQYVVTAASFKTFGVSTWTGRFPFVLFGLGSLALFWLIVMNNFGKELLLRLYAFAVFGLSMTFLLHIRQCRYFSLTLFFGLLTFVFYQRTRQTKRFRDALMMGAAAGLLFYSHHLLSAVFLVSLAGVHLLFYRNEKGAWASLLCGVGLFFALSVPYAVAFKIWQRPDLQNTQPWLLQRVQLFWWTVREFNSMNILPWGLAIPTIGFLWVKRKNDVVRRSVWPFAVMAAACAVSLALLTEMASGMVEAPMRFFLFMTPFCAVTVGSFCAFVHQRQKWVAIGLVGGLCATNVFGLAPGNTKLRWLLPAFLREVHRDYPTSYREVSKYLKTNAARDAKVVCFPEYCTYPLMFYVGDRVLFSDLLETREQVAKEGRFSIARLDALKAPLFADEHFPEYLISFGQQPLALELMRFFSRPHAERGKSVQYIYEHVSTLPIYCADESRPELPRHAFGPRKAFSPEDGVAIYKAKRVER